jgi:hypothetical protein
MRTSLILLLVAAACGKDGTSPDTNPDAGVAPDGKLLGDASASEPDAIVELTECQEAIQHADLTWIQQKVFTPSCATAMCHAGADPEVGLNLEAGRTYNNLVNKNASTVQGWQRVVPGSLATSYLVVAFGRADGPPPRDGFMPLGADALCVEKLEAVERWILAGAPNN